MEERRALEHRVAALRPWLEPLARPAEDDEATIALSEMFQAFPALRGDTGMAIVSRINAAMTTLAEFPLWAIEQGCAEVRRRGYTMVDRGEERVERHWPPSEADVAKVVEDVVRLRRAALRGAEDMLAASVEPQADETAEQKARLVEGWREEWARRTVAPAELEQVLAEGQAARAERTRKGAEDRVRAEYAARGLEVPKGALVSLSTRLAMGWRVEESPRGNYLVAPVREPVEPRETQAWEMGS